MIQHPALLLALFCAIVFGVRALAKAPGLQKLFNYLPTPLWCYFLPTLLSTSGVIPQDAPLYGLMGRHLLPACLMLLLVGTDVPALFRLSRQALLAMIVGSAGIFVGALLTFVLIFKWRGPSDPLIASSLWSGWGCLSASWTGGSANMIAVREALQTPELLFSNLIVTDAFGAYAWMALLVAAVPYQDRINHWLGATEPETTLIETSSGNSASIRAEGVAFLLAFGAFGGWACWQLAGLIPSIGIFSRSLWNVLLASVLPLALSFTPAKKLERLGAEKTGMFLLYTLLVSVGARANLSHLTQAPYFILAGILWIGTMAVFLLAAGRVLKLPVSLLATASQANVGGTISTPLVAGIYGRGMAPLGILLAVLGNVYGTALGLLVAGICSTLADLI